MNRFLNWEICSPSGKWEKVRGDRGGREGGKKEVREGGMYL